MSKAQQNIDLSQINTTGIRIITLFSLLLDSPKSAEELNEAFFKHPLIRTQFSDDTIRNDINTLRNLGCRISRAIKTNGNRYVLLEHPFELDLKASYVDALKRGYNKVYQKLDCDELIQLESLFLKLALYTKNNAIKEKLSNISAIRFIDKNLLKELLHHSFNKHQIIIKYKSSNGNFQEIELVADDIAFRHDKLYFFAYNVKLKCNGFYLIKNILNIKKVNLFASDSVQEDIKVVYKILDTKFEDYSFAENEHFLKSIDNDLIIECSNKNEFIMIQNIIRLGKKCIVLEPLDFRKRFIKYLKTIREVYGAN